MKLIPRFLLGTSMLVTCILTLPACQSSGIVERLDRDSGLTVITASTPVAYARTEARVSRSARDYVYLGPVEINERGTRQYFLWVGMASTIDRARLGESSPDPAYLYFDDAGTPIELPLAPWADRVPRLAAQRIYHPAVAPSSVLAARVSLDQLGRIQRLAPPRLSLAEDEAASIEYLLWNGESFWRQFLEYADTGFER
jgi:hypothetical protein